MLRITHNRKLKHISLGYAVKKKDFNPKARNNNYVRSSHPEHKLINVTIAKKLREAREKLYDLQILTPNTIEKAVKGENGESFIAFSKNYLENLSNNPDKIGTYRRYKTIIQKLKDYLKGKDLLFDEIDHNFLENYRNYLYGIGNKTNTVSGNLKVIRTFLYEAIKLGKFKQEKNPFFTFRLERKKPFKEALSQNEIQSLADVKLNINTLQWHARNYFMLSFYLHGIRVGDFIQLKYRNLQEGRVIYQMGKTDTIKSIKINDKAACILNQYLRNDAKPNDYIFPLLDNDKDYSDEKFLYAQVSSKNALINKFLKLAAKKAGIEKNISFHIARHSFANIARSKIGDISKIQAFLGHSNIRITQEYLATLSGSELDEDSENVYN